MTDEKKITPNLNDEQLNDVTGGGNNLGKITAAAYLGFALPVSIASSIILATNGKRKPSRDEIGYFINTLREAELNNAAVQEWANERTREEQINEVQEALNDIERQQLHEEVHNLFLNLRQERLHNRILFGEE